MSENSIVEAVHLLLIIDTILQRRTQMLLHRQTKKKTKPPLIAHIRKRYYPAFPHTHPAPLTPRQSGRIPPQLRNFHDPLAASRFEEYYLNLVTQEFGDDLYSIRDAKDFDPARSMPMLVRALKQGVNIFDPDEKRMLISSLSKGEGE